MKHTLMILLGMSCIAPLYAADHEVPYPSGYRDWHHVKSMVIEAGHPLHASFGGIHHLYANKAAMQGYQSGHFPDGAVIIFDLFEAQRAENTVTEGAHKVLGVMHKDAKKFTETGGWGFEGFGGGDPDQRVVQSDAKDACFSCHAPQKDRDYVFSSLRDQK